MGKKELVSEYNAYFQKKPFKWTSDERNELCRSTVQEFLGRGPISAIDIGCGNGHTLDYLSKKWKKTDMVGVDLSDVGIGIAKARGLKKVEFITGFLEEITIKTKFELAILLGVAEHFDSPASMLELIRDKFILPDGIMYLELPHNLSYPESDKHEGFRRLACGSHQTEWHLTRETWEDIIHSAGFEIEKSVVGTKPQWEFIWILRAGV